MVVDNFLIYDKENGLESVLWIMDNKSLKNVVVKHPKAEKRFKGCGLDLLNWENENLAKLLDCLDESTNPNDFLDFWFKENGEEKCATLHKGNYQDFDYAYYIKIGKDVDLFSSKDEVIDFLKYLSKHK